jgi:hypothetical protein
MSPQHAPSVLVILVDLSGQSQKPLPRLKERRLVTVTRSSLSVLFRHLQPGIQFSSPVANNEGHRDFILRLSEAPALPRKSVIDQLCIQGFGPESTGELADLVLTSKQLVSLTASWNGVRWC